MGVRHLVRTGMSGAPVASSRVEIRTGQWIDLAMPGKLGGLYLQGYVVSYPAVDRYTVLLLLASTMLLAACGKKGPLYLPTSKAPTALAVLAYPGSVLERL